MGHMRTVFLIFRNLLHCFSQMLHQCAFALTVYRSYLSPHSQQQLLLLQQSHDYFFIIAMLTDVKQYLIVVLIDISLISDIEHLFTHQLITCKSVFGKMSLSLKIFLLGGSFRLPTKLRRKYRVFSYIPHPTHAKRPPIINITHQDSTVLSKNESTMIHQNHPKSPA